MQKVGILLVLISSLFISFKENAYLMEGLTSEITISERGAENVHELSDAVFNSIKQNDFEMLAQYLPSQSDIEFLEKQSSPRGRYLFEYLDAEKLYTYAKINFDNIILNGIKLEINWSEVEIQESKISLCKAMDQRMCEGQLTIQDNKGRNLKISFDMIKVRDRWFLFQKLSLEGEKASLK